MLFVGSLTPETRHIIGKRNSKDEKTPVINIGRGRLSMRRADFALDEKLIAGAGLDVTYRTPPEGESALGF
jgi:phosphoglycerate dehydrogenase-like enzyme